MNIILFIIFILVYGGLGLLPYYVAYLIIEPHSFFGIVGVFFLGSIIVPLSTMLASSIVAFISVILGIAKKEDKTYKKQEIIDGFYEIKNVSETKNTSKKYRNVFIGGAIIVVTLILIGVFIQNNKNYPQEEKPLNTQEISAESSPSIDNQENNINYEEAPTNLEVTNPSIIDDNNLMSSAVNAVVNRVNDAGLVNLIKDIRSCYLNANTNKLYCVYIDNSAKLLDIAISNAYKIPRNEYLYNDRVLQRAYKYLYAPNNISDFTVHIAKIENEIRPLLYSAIRSLPSDQVNENSDKINKNDGVTEDIIEDRNFNEINESNRINEDTTEYSNNEMNN